MKVIELMTRLRTNAVTFLFSLLLTCGRPAQSSKQDCLISSTVYNCSGRSLSSLELDYGIPDGVEVLDFSYNRITLVQEIENISSIKHLNLSHNNIDNITDDAFHNIGDALKTLDLSFNDIHGNILTNKSFRGLNQVSSIILSHNPLGPRITDTAFHFSHGSGLNLLDLSFCQISSITNAAFAGLPNMRTLNLSNNGIEKFSKDIFNQLYNLEVLDLGNNKLKTLVSFQFTSLDAIKTITLSRNLISSIDDDTFRGLTELKNINLQDNKLQQFPFVAVSQLLSLVVLDLSRNPIKTISKPILPQNAALYIETIRLEYMHELQTIRAYAFAGINNLKEVYITHNHRLYIINETAFGSDDFELEKVYLNDNSLVTISKELLPWNDLEELSLANNIWNCDCYLSWLLNETFTSEHSISMRCSSPESLGGRNLLELSPADLTCNTRSESYGQPYVAVMLPILLAALVAISAVITALFFCLKKKLPFKKKPRGKYVMVYTQDADEAHLELTTPNDRTALKDSVDV